MRVTQLSSTVFAAVLLSLATGSYASEATTPVDRDADSWQQRHQRMNEAAAEESWELVLIGNSITHGWEGAGKEVWQEFYGDRQAGNLGIGGDQTQHVLWRLKNGNLKGQSPRVAAIMIGTNNLAARHTPAEVVGGVTAVVQAVHKASPETQVLLLGIFPRGQSPDNPFRAQIKTVNQGLSKLANEQTIHYLDIGHTFLEEDGSLSKDIMPDFLHLSPEGYRRWAKAMEPKLAELLGEDPSRE